MKISQYQEGVVNNGVLLLGTDTQDGNQTKNYSIEDVVSLPQVQPTALNFFDFSTGETTTADEDVWTPLLCETTQGFQRNGLSLVEQEGSITTTQMVYNGSVSKQVRFSFIASVTGTASRRIHLALFKNGTLVPCSEFAQTIPSGNSEITIAGQCVTEMANNDVIEVYAKCSTHALSIVLDNINVIANQF